MSNQFQNRSDESIVGLVQGILLAIVLSCMIAASLFVGDADYRDSAADQARYCEMVRKHYETRGMAGWPDYKGNANKRCFASQSVSEVKW